jgi:5-methylcytosine-specific restriction endonuclease McrBC GTP-binding regulatory subunit McrB
MNEVPRQAILFGSPGTGKSRHVARELLPKIGIDGEESPNVTRVVFHPEYSYGDFMGKLMPLTKEGQVQYNFYAGHFMQALAKAYRNILEAGSVQEAQNVALVIEEINRGNSAAIFGTAFQLLDRNDEDRPDGWSEYPVQLSKMEFGKMMEEMGADKGKNYVYLNPDSDEEEEYRIERFYDLLEIERKRKIRLPPNLYLLATMNTSNESIYHMDVAFKRRWHWQYMDIEEGIVSEEGAAFMRRGQWEKFVDNLNAFIRDHHKYVRRVEDKQIGHWFLQGEGKEENTEFQKSDIQNKVMFFVWDSVFASSKKPLADLLGLDESELVTFGSFADRVDDFIDAVENRDRPTN